MRKFFKPILELTILSTVFSLSFSKDIYTFFKYFVIFCIIQFIIYNIYKSIIELFVEKLKNERIKEYTKQGMEVSCPCYLEKKMLLPLELNSNNIFNCLECKKDISVNITAKSFLLTETVDLDKADSACLEAYKKIQNS